MSGFTLARQSGACHIENSTRNGTLVLNSECLMRKNKNDDK